MIPQAWHNYPKQQFNYGGNAMPKNKIQFQKGLSLQRFHQLYGAEEQCRAMLFKYRWPNGFTCPKCGHKHFYKLTSRILYQCCSCRFQNSLSVLFLPVPELTNQRHGLGFLKTASDYLVLGHISDHPVQGRYVYAQPVSMSWHFCQCFITS